MIAQIQEYGIFCDGCGKAYNYVWHESSALRERHERERFSSPESAETTFNNNPQGWVMREGAHLCPACLNKQI